MSQYCTPDGPQRDGKVVASGLTLSFDRGTILLRGPRQGAALTDLPGVLWDPRIGAYRAPARCYSDICAALATLGIRPRDETRPSVVRPARWRQVELRPYQEGALCAWELSDRRGVVVLPTGSGKTLLAVAAMAGTGLRSLCLVPTRALLEQWIRVVGEFYKGPVGCFGDGERVLRPVTVATFESAYRYMDRIGNHFDLLVVDEAHHFGCGLRDEALEMTLAEARLGLTATPIRQGAAPERLGELIGQIVFELAISDLAGSFLAPFEVLTLHLDLTALRNVIKSDHSIPASQRPVSLRRMPEPELASPQA